MLPTPRLPKGFMIRPHLAKTPLRLQYPHLRHYISCLGHLARLLHPSATLSWYSAQYQLLCANQLNSFFYQLTASRVCCMKSSNKPAPYYSILVYYTPFLYFRQAIIATYCDYNYSHYTIVQWLFHQVPFR